MNTPLFIRDDLIIPAVELSFTAVRSGGPGGQHVNKTSSCVILEWNLNETSCLNEIQKTTVKDKLKSRISAEGILKVSVETERSQYRNLQLAREKLAAMIRGALEVQKKRVPTKITFSAIKRRLEQKRRKSNLKQQRKFIEEG